MLYIYKITKTREHLFVYNKSIDKYYSIIWNTRYNECGDFELEVGSEEKKYIDLGDIILSDFSDRGMIVESISGELNDGKYIYKISGRSMESILDSRNNVNTINETNINPGDLIKKIITENFVYDGFSYWETVDNLRISDEYTVNDKITSISTEYSSFGENVYTMIKDICNFFDIGFKIRIIADERVVIMLFELYTGYDRSIRSNEKCSKVMLSDILGNIKNANVAFENVGEVNLLKSITKVNDPNEFVVEKNSDISRVIFEYNNGGTEPHSVPTEVSNKSFNSISVNGPKDCMCYVPMAGVNGNDICTIACSTNEIVPNYLPYIEIYFVKDNAYTSKKFVSSEGKIVGTFTVPSKIDKVLMGFSKPWPNELPVACEYSNIQYNHGRKIFPYKPYGEKYTIVKEIYKGSDHVFRDENHPEEVPPVNGIAIRDTIVDIPYDKSPDFDLDRTLVSKSKEIFREKSVTKNIEFEINNENNVYVYGRDYSIGDVVSVIIDNNEIKARVTELCYSEDSSGIKKLPKFELV